MRIVFIRLKNVTSSSCKIKLTAGCYLQRTPAVAERGKRRLNETIGQMALRP